MTVVPTLAASAACIAPESVRAIATPVAIAPSAPSVSVCYEYPTCVHIAVAGAVSERSAVMLARNFATRHYGAPVGHWVSSGWSAGASTYVFSNPAVVPCRHGKTLGTCVAGEHNGAVRHPMASPRAMALTHAAARRELWSQHHAHSTPWLRKRLAVHEYLAGDYCRRLNGDHSVRVATWYVRMIRSELRRRGVTA